MTGLNEERLLQTLEKIADALSRLATATQEIANAKGAKAPPAAST